MGRHGTLPVAIEERERVVCHVDMDCFYAACERLREPPLRGEPLVVGMGYEADEPHGAVATASYEAREFGVESAQAISEALEKLPRKVEAAKDPDLAVEEAGFYRPVDLDFYKSVAAEVKEILHDEADRVREVSIDEAYLDVTDRIDWDEDLHSFGHSLKSRIDEEVGVTASIGIAPAMTSDHDKPDGLVVVEPGDVREFLAPLPVEEVHGVGPVTANEFREMGIETAGDLAGADAARIEERFGERGLEVHRFARGEDSRPVEPKGKPKSLNRESAFTDPTAETETKRERVRALAGDVAERAQQEGALYQTIGIKVVTPPFDVHTRARSLPGPVEDAALVEEVALELLTEFADDRVRKLGVRVSNLQFTEEDQSSLDGWENNTGESGGDDTDDTNENPGAPDETDSVDASGSHQSRNTDGQQSLWDFE
ncbi:DNA polymerase IV [Salinibaculum salinum]|uniref:DNA polymerase Y family protein n=1 Tax=Salinibaculum salinum TaxID=3131996 RepID=UPI0030EC1087